MSSPRIDEETMEQAGLPTAGSNLVVATFAENESHVAHVAILAESVRAFAGACREAPIWLYVPADYVIDDTIADRLDALDVKIKRSDAPAEALRLLYARKVFAAATAETEAADRYAILVWIDEDTVFLDEPMEFALPQSVSIAYRPVMHNIIGSLYSEPPNEFWRRLYDLMSVPEDALFPMTTPADRQTIRAYFNAGLLVVRPEREVLRAWANYFETLYGDATLMQWVEQDELKRIFLHQTALVGAVLNSLRRDEMVELSERYNYPVFFKEMFGAEAEFDTLDAVVTLRYDVYFRNPAPDWAEKLKGPADRIAWLKQRLGRR
jgi:hypothetical protein